MIQPKIRTRYAPSPTGPLHVGGVRTALFNYLFAKKNGGEFVLRIEDTDRERSDPKFEKDIFEGLKWLGIEWDGEVMRQSERIGLYKKYIEKLLMEKKAFFCQHSEKELEDEKRKQLVNKESQRHACSSREQNLKEGIIRFKNTRTATIVFNDLIRGEISFVPSLLGDFSLAKNPETPLYNFAVVVDDFEMEISHVIRGEDHISNTQKQLLLIEALGFKKPEYAHLPLILGTDRSKLSKRRDAASVNKYREMGYLPEALFNFMALLGWNPGDNREIFSKQELIELFSLEKVQKSGAIFNIKKLDWLNGEYIRKKMVEELTELCIPYLEKSDFPKFDDVRKSDFTKLKKIMALEQPRLKKLSEIGERTDYFFRQPNYDKELLRWKGMTDEELAVSLDKSIELLQNKSYGTWSHSDLEDDFLKKIVGGDKGKLLWPLRVALTGKKASPGPFEIMEILGKEESLKRLTYAKKILRGNAS